MATDFYSAVQKAVASFCILYGPTDIVTLGSGADRVQCIFLHSARGCATINDEHLSYFLITLVGRGLGIELAHRVIENHGSKRHDCLEDTLTAGRDLVALPPFSAQTC
jgi:hypothetical protein